MAEPWVTRLDFKTRSERIASLADARTDRAEGIYYWIDVDALDPDAHASMQGLGIDDAVITEALGLDVDGRYDVYDDCLHIAATSMGIDADRLVRSHVDIIIGEHIMLTVRRGHVEFIEQVRKRYRQDFLKFSRSPSFLIYECFDTLIQSYRKCIAHVEAQVERVQAQIFGEVDDKIFGEVADITNDVLVLRNVMLAVRDVLHELANRQSEFVSETSRPYLDRMTDTVDRLVSDLGVGREILSETLTLYMGMVGHRTNLVMRRLTMVSLIFLPLTFLCGVYGMNFDPNTMMPELTWPYGYRAFWLAVGFITLGTLIFMRRKKWL